MPRGIPTKKKEYPKQCRFCGIDFISNHPKKEYCTKKHKRLARLEREQIITVDRSERNCIICGNSTISPYPESPVCSENCFNIAKQEKKLFYKFKESSYNQPTYIHRRSD